jgi:RNA polymerase sigma-70 factor (ECF subfamily)
MNRTAGERELIAACQHGDREAFGQIFDLYKDRVWSVALHYSGNETAARDITQQVFLKLFTTIQQFRHDAGFATWLYRLTANVCLDEHRRNRRVVHFGLFRDDEDDETDEISDAQWQSVAVASDERLTQRELSESVKLAVQQLTPKLRIAILLRYFEDLSYEEMADVLGCSAGTVASRLNRGHRALAERLAHLRNQLSPR